MKHKLNIILPLIVIVLFACTGNQASQEEVEVIKIPGKRDFILKYDIDNLLDTVYYIALEDKNGTELIGRIKKVLVHNDRIIILDRDVTHSLYIYSMKGKHIHTMNYKGKGPGEFEDPVDFTIIHEREEILVFCKSQRKLIYYDLNGEFLSEEKTELDFNSMSYLGDDKLAIFAHNIFNYTDREKEVPYNLLMINNKGEVLSHYFRSDARNQQGSSVYSFGNYFSDNKGNKLVHWCFNDTIYEVQQEAVLPKYRVDVGKHQIDPRQYQSDGEIFRSLIYGEDNLWSIYSQLEFNQSYVMFKLLTGSYDEEESNIYNVLYDTKRKDLTVFKRIRPGRFLNKFTFPLSTSDEYFISILYPMDIIENEHESYQSLSAVFDTISMYDNPILQFIKFKE